MTRSKKLDRVPKTINIDRDLDKMLTRDYPSQASDLVNELLRKHLVKQEEKGEDLIRSNTNAGRLAYTQALERLGFPKNTDWSVLHDDFKLKFLDVYKKRLIELEARGF